MADIDQAGVGGLATSAPTRSTSSCGSWAT
jgi:hypothetical protein